MRTLISILVANALAISSMAVAADTVQVNDDAQKIAELQRQLADITDELDDINSRVDKTERHTALDRISITGDFRTKVHSLHYQNV